eukprot:TRINITY_DN25427_c0_g1_i1.p1 TRINITY_DN25427_c0_g1~~TRINITY_DN25427_c0_g1_i1.p1  ORF type:complete len:263 (+),score=72.30 TRINITY_DN25427_c0_g1_i1:86-874(+)
MAPICFFFFFFKQKTAYEMLRSLVGSEMCIRDRDEAPPEATPAAQLLPSPLKASPVALRRQLKVQLAERRCPTSLLTPFKAQPRSSKKRSLDQAWTILCDGWEYRWGRQRKQRFLDQLMAPEEPGHVCYESIEIRAADASEQYEVKVGDFVYYEYDDDFSVASVLLLYADAEEVPCWKHDSFYNARDMQKDPDEWRLPKDAVPFNPEHELVYSAKELEDVVALIDGCCTVRQVTQPRSSSAVISAINRCERETDSFFWRYSI